MEASPFRMWLLQPQPSSWYGSLFPGCASRPEVVCPPAWRDDRMMTETERALSDAERAQLSARLANARAESKRALLKPGGASAAVCGVLAILTLIASEAPRWVIVLFWGALWLLFT